MTYYSETFPIELAFKAMGPNAERWKQHLYGGKIKFLADADNPQRLEHARPNGWGRGQKLQLSIYAILQGAIALRAIDCGVEVERAYTIAESVVWSGVGGMPGTSGKWGERLPGPAFKQGQTWIAIAQYSGDDGDAADFLVVSDADPHFQDENQSALQAMEMHLPDAFGGSPFIAMRLNGIWEQIADALALPLDDIREGLD
ncbi:MAG: hypothetical protein AAFQ12_14145 [Pseudomonadota bacterium]